MPLAQVLESVQPKSNYVLHLNLGSIQGESQSALHPQEIEISSFSLGATNSAVRSTAGTTKGGKPTVSEILVTKHIDKASPSIYNALVSSTQIKTVKISMSKQTGGGKYEDHLVITLGSVYITSVQTGHSDAVAHKGAETISLNFQTIEMVYSIQLASGLLAAGTSWTYSLASAS